MAGAHLDIVARRDFVVLRPLRLVLENVPADAPPALLPAPDFPRDAASRTHPVALSRVVYIEADDFRAVDSPDFYGLAPGKVAGLRYAGYVRATGHDVDPATGAVTEVRGVYDAARSPGFAGRDAAGRDVRVRGNLSFASGDAPFVEVRLYGHLFATEVPGSTGDWEAELAPDSETVLPRARANPHLLAPGVAPPGSHIQAERVGFFVVDRDSDVAPDETGARVRRLVLNLTLGLKEAKEAGGAAGGAGKV